MFKQISMITQSIILSIFYSFRDPVKLSKLELVRKENAYQKAVENLASSRGGMDEIKKEVSDYNNKIKVIDERVEYIKKNRHNSENERRKDIEDLLIEKYSLQKNVDDLTKSIEYGDKASKDAFEKIKDLEVNLREHRLAIRALELKKQANDARGLLVNTLYDKQLGTGNLEDAEREINREGYFIENKEGIIKQLTVGSNHRSDIRQRVQEELDAMELN
jgi:hypothetical protein